MILTDGIICRGYHPYMPASAYYFGTYFRLWVNPKKYAIKQEGGAVAQHFGDPCLLADCYFLSADALGELERQNSRNRFHVHLISKAKSPTVAYEPAPPQKPGQRGAPRKKGARVKLMDLFQGGRGGFQAAEAMMYGKMQAVRYCCADLLWGQGRYQKLRFVLVEYDGKKSILASTDLGMDPVEIIEAYCRRFRTEASFREFKQQIGGMAYRFWTGAMPRLSHFWKKADPYPLEAVAGEDDRGKIRRAVRATEMYVMMSCTPKTK